MSTQLDYEFDAQALAEDRRRSDRTPQDVQAWLSGPTGSRESAGQQARVTDLSLHGVGLESPRALKHNDRLWIVIAAPSMRLSSRVRIVSSVEQPDGTWRSGGEFF
ncbi:MAG: PilZ domain-containing protein [Phycisphaerae bacterium]